MSIKLTGISFGVTPRIPGVRSGDLAAIDCDNPSAALKDWRIILRPQSVFFISPPGWLPNNAGRPNERDPKGPIIVHEVPRTEAYLQWQSDEDLEAFFKVTNKYESQPLGWKPAPVEAPRSILSQIPANQLGD